MKSLRGQLLISSGNLFDPNFRHTVVLVAQHDEEGALGVILNRPTDQTVADTVAPLAEWVSESDLLFVGGPVRPRMPVLLAEFTRPELADVLAFGSIGFLSGEVDPEVRPEVLRARVYAGYSGWGAAQLEAELEFGSWIVEPAEADDVFTPTPDLLWSRVLERKGGTYSRLAKMPFDPSMN